MKKKILSAILALCLLLTMLPTAATPAVAAASATYDLTQGSVAINDSSPENITVNGNNHQQTTNTIQITGTKNHTVTLNGLNIMSSSTSINPISIDSAGITTLMLSNLNNFSFSISSRAAAVRKATQGTLVIAGTGTLAATGGYFSDHTGGAAIGGNDGKNTANIIIQSGTIQATSLSCAAAIGGGNQGSATNIQITDGDVRAESAYGAAIGGGGNFTGGTNTYTGRNIVISGGTVSAYSHDGNKCMAIGDGNVSSSDGYGQSTNGWGNVLQPKTGMVSKVEYPENGTQITSYTGNYGTDQQADITRIDNMTISFVAGHKLTVQNGTGDGLYLVGKPVNISTEDVDYNKFTKWTIYSGSAAFADSASKTTTLTMGDSDVTVTANRIIDYDSLKFFISPVSIKGQSGKTQQFTVRAKYNGTELTADQMAGLSYLASWGLTGGTNSFINAAYGLLDMGVETENIKVTAQIAVGGKIYTAAADVIYSEADAGDLTVSGGLPGTDYTYADDVLTFTGSGTYLVGMKPGVTAAATRIVVNGGSPNITMQNVNISTDSNANSIFCVRAGFPTVTISGTNSLINTNTNDGSNGINVVNGCLTLDGGDSDTLTVKGNYYSVVTGGTLTIKGGHYIFGNTSSNIGTAKVAYNATCTVQGGVIELLQAWQGRDCNVINAEGNFCIIPAEGKQAVVYREKNPTKYLTEPYSTGMVKGYYTKIYFSDSLPAITAALAGEEATSADLKVFGSNNAKGYYRLYEGGVSPTPLAGDIMGNSTGTIDLSKDTVSDVSLTGLKEGTAYDCCIVAVAGSGDGTQVSKVVKVHFTTKMAPMTATFDKYTSSDGYKDISLSLNGNTLSNISNGDTALVKDSDYTISEDGGTVTILKSYLATLSSGKTVLILKFNAGTDQSLVVTVKNTVPTPMPTPAPMPSTPTALPTIIVNALTGAQAGLSGAVFSPNVTSLAFFVMPETPAGIPQGAPDGKADPQGAATYNSAVHDSALNIIGVPYLYNIKLLDQSGNPVSFTGSVTVSIPLPAGLRGKPRVFRNESDSTLTDMNATVKNGFLVFSTTHFSNYIIAGTGSTISLDTSNYQMPVGGKYQIGVSLTGKKNVSVKIHSTNNGTLTAKRLENGNIQAEGKGVGTAYVMVDVYDGKNQLLSHVSTCIDVKQSAQSRGDSTRQMGVYTVPDAKDSLTLDTKNYVMSVGGTYQISAWLTEGQAIVLKYYSTNSKIASVTKLANGNYQVTGKGTGTAYIMFDVYGKDNHLLTHASTRVDVKTGIRPHGDSTRQYGIF